MMNRAVGSIIMAGTDTGTDGEASAAGLTAGTVSPAV